MSDDDVASVIENFLVSLPETIRNNILIFVLVYAFDYGLSKPDDLVAALSDELDQRSGLRRFGVSLRMIGAIEFVLARYIDTIQRQKGMWSIYQERVKESEKVKSYLEEMKLRAPMEERHAQQALAEWDRLRSNELSFPSLLRFESECTSPSFPSE